MLDKDFGIVLMCAMLWAPSFLVRREPDARPTKGEIGDAVVML